MSTNEKILIAGIDVDVVRKDIKNMHLAVYPPTGRVRLAVPHRVGDDAMRLFAISKLGWIKKHQKNFRDQPREAIREYVTGESYYLKGKRYQLNLVNHKGAAKVSIRNNKHLNLHIKPNSTKLQKAKVVKEWYRQELKKEIPTLIKKWESKMGVTVNDWGVKFMRTKWGTCNIRAKRIWLNLELAKKPLQCLEYIVVHEMVHLLERNHNDRFVAYMDQFMPKWRLHRKKLNSLPVSHLEWGY